MASLRKHARSRFWYACFTAPDGTRFQRSTGKTSRKEAQDLANQWEAFSKERKSKQKALKTFSDLYRIKHGEDLPNSTVRSFMVGWCGRRAGEVSKATLEAYEGASRRFLTWLGGDADSLLVELDKARMIEYRNDQAAKISPATANKHIKLLRVILEDARREGYVAENPAKDVPRLKVDPFSSRRPLSLDEIRMILGVANDEWRSLIYFGLYTGQRLSDIASLTWANVDLADGEVHLRTRKTGRVVRVPLCGPLAAHVESLPSSDQPNAPLHPHAYSVVSNGPASPLSAEFRGLLVAAGLTPASAVSHKSKGVGRDGKRAESTISFHSLRHTATSLMKTAGVSESVVMDIIGHESVEVSRLYTRIGADAKRKAVDTLPDLLSEGR